MQEKIDLGQGAICTLKKSRRARRVRMTLYRDGRVVLTLPFFVSYKEGRAFLQSKIEWIRKKTRDIALRPENILSRGSVEEYRSSRVAAEELISERLHYFQKSYAVVWKRLSIRNQKTRWGSCSRQGSLSFNYRLLLLPAYLRDYVIVHELCHLLELNHSKRFWALVARTFPDYKGLRRELRLL